MVTAHRPSSGPVGAPRRAVPRSHAARRVPRRRPDLRREGRSSPLLGRGSATGVCCRHVYFDAHSAPSRPGGDALTRPSLAAGPGSRPATAGSRPGCHARRGRPRAGGPQVSSRPTAHRSAAAPGAGPHACLAGWCSPALRTTHCAHRLAARAAARSWSSSWMCRSTVGGSKWTMRCFSSSTSSGAPRPDSRQVCSPRSWDRRCSSRRTQVWRRIARLWSSDPANLHPSPLSRIRYRRSHSKSVTETPSTRATRTGTRVPAIALVACSCSPGTGSFCST